jgi:hypothetical protein
MSIYSILIKLFKYYGNGIISKPTVSIRNTLITFLTQWFQVIRRIWPRSLLPMTGVAKSLQKMERLLPKATHSQQVDLDLPLPC